jgi:hypothetical protein
MMCPNAKYGFRRQGELRDAPATSSNPRWKCNIHGNPLKWQNVAKYGKKLQNHLNIVLFENRVPSKNMFFGLS